MPDPTVRLPPNAALRYDVVERMLRQVPVRQVLEIGCGQGAFGARLARDRDYLAVEPDPTSFAVARNRIEAVGGTVRNIDHTGIPERTTFDLVCAFEVLEHLDDDKAAVAEWSRLVRTGGHLMISVPAWPQRYGAWDTAVGHYRRYTPQGLSAVVESAGLVVSDWRLYGWPLGLALETARNAVARRQLARGATDSWQERTARSGRVLQPGRIGGAVSALGVAPFRYLQRLAPRRGTGLVALARQP